MSKFVVIPMYCELAKQTVKLECEPKVLHPSIQTIVPKICRKLRRDGCRFIEPLGKADKKCLLGKEVQGNFEELKHLL